MYVYIYLSTYLPIYLPIYLSIYLSIYLWNAWNAWNATPSMPHVAGRRGLTGKELRSDSNHNALEQRYYYNLQLFSRKNDVESTKLHLMALSGTVASFVLFYAFIVLLIRQCNFFEVWPSLFLGMAESV